MPLSEGRKVGDYPISITVSPTGVYVLLLTASLIYSKSLKVWSKSDRQPFRGH